jgi:hypothetical protein
MIPDGPIALAEPATGRARLFRRVAGVQGAYFLLTGLWPLFGVDSFQSVTGAKTDLWLVYTVGCLVAVIGVGLIVAAVGARMTPEVIVMAVGSAIVLAGIDLVFVLRGVISWVYLLDALAEGALIAWWVLSYVGPRRAAATRPYTHLQRLLSRRAQSVSPQATVPAQPGR